MYTVGHHCIKKYIINEIYADGYERFATIKEIGQDAEWNVHFIEYDEYLENGEASGKKKKGDLLEGNLSISLVTFSRRAEEDFCHHQDILKSPHIEAIIEVRQIIDAYTIYAVSSILEDAILIEFESAIDYKVGERILVVGSLELRGRKDVIDP
ncbi:MAG: hypothetical protein K2N95_15475 [Lachnospiraceae bacterium]|nr:hypothetical protein [Lachnospiraceae bacterium]